MLNKSKFVSTFIIIIVLGITGSASALAEKAVPGDLLYGMKIYVNEPIAGLFVWSQEDKLRWQTALAERRLTETAELASRNGSPIEAVATNTENLQLPKEAVNTNPSPVKKATSAIITQSIHSPTPAPAKAPVVTPAVKPSIRINNIGDDDGSSGLRYNRSSFDDD